MLEAAMKAMIVYAHPEPTSFNGALKDRAVACLERAGHEVVVSDLYGEGFEPRAGRHDFVEICDPHRFDYQVEQEHATYKARFAPDLERQHERLLWCELLIVQFPMWWFGPPAILKGWIDRVLAYRRLYDLDHRFATGMLKGRRGILSVTTGGTPERFSAEGIFGEIDQYLKPLQFGMLEYLGMEALDPFVTYAASRVSREALTEQLQAWERRLTEIAAEIAAAGPAGDRKLASSGAA
jgi:NAD(P)H dehydrogenase (quinone)